MSASPVGGNSPSSIYTAPVVSTTGTSTITVASVKDPTKTQTVTVTLSLPMTFTTTPGALAAASTGTTYPSTPILVAGGTGTKTFTIASGSLPAGLTMSTSGVITGTPTGSAGTANFTVHVVDQSSSPAVLSGAFSITVGSAPLAWVTPAAGSQTYTVGTPITPIVLSATGGTGTISYSLNSGNLPAGLQITGNQVTGTPTAPTAVAGNVVNFLATDSATPKATVVSASVTLVVNPVSTLLTLPAPSPASLVLAAINAPYSGSINATGGTAGYTWTVNGTAVPTNGTSLGITDGLAVSNAGGSASLSVTGVPTSTGTVTFTASIKDSIGNTAGPFTYSIVVSNVYNVGGNINSSVGCTTSGLSNVTVSINTVPVQTTTTTANGSFSFVNVPNGTYTITPSINGSSSAFYPATETVVVNGSNLTATSITATLGYTVSGTVAYTGSQTGQIYLTLNPTGNCGGRSPGTSVSSTGAFAIRGVPPGAYTLQAFMDTVGDGVPNAANPIGSAAGVSPTTSDVSGVSATLVDPAPVVLTTAPTLTTVAAFNSGVMAQYKPIVDISGLEMASYYTLQWSTSPTFATITGSKRFPANGTHSNIWFLHSLTNGGVFYFRTYATSAGTVTGPFSSVVGPITVAAPTLGNVVTGSVSFATPASGPLYVGYYDQGTGAFYGQFFASPVSAQPFTIQVPTGSDYLFVGFVDQNNDGAIDAGDITNLGNGTSQAVTVISGPLSNQSLTLPSVDGIASVTTQNTQSISPTGTLQHYNINFQVSGLIKQPVAACADFRRESHHAGGYRHLRRSGKQLQPGIPDYIQSLRHQPDRWRQLCFQCQLQRRNHGDINRCSHRRTQCIFRRVWRPRQEAASAQRRPSVGQTQLARVATPTSSISAIRAEIRSGRFLSETQTRMASPAP